MSVSDEEVKELNETSETSEAKESKESKESKGKIERKRLIYKVVFVVALVGFVICAGVLFRNWWVQYQAIKQNQQNASNTTETESTETESTETETQTQPTDWEAAYLEHLGITIPQKNVDWQDMWKQNEHVYAWLYLPNTTIDYPVLQHPTQNDYYLTHNLDHTGPRPACIYSHNYNSKDFSDNNTILYGHRGVMFSDLGNFEDPTFFEQNRYVYIYLPDGTAYVYEIIASVSFSDVLISAKYDINDAYQCSEFVQKLYEVREMNSHTKTDFEYVPGNRLLTLSTCFPWPTRQDERYLVVGALVNDPILIEAWQQEQLGDE